MAFPTYVDSGAKTEGTVAASVALPTTKSTNDILLLCVEEGNTVTGSITNAGGGTWTEVTNSPQSVGATTTFAGVRVFWSRYDGAQTAPTWTPPANHFEAVISGFAGCPTSGDPWDVTAGSTDSSGDTAFVASGPTTTVVDCLVVIVAVLADDSPTFGATWTNANLASITNRVTFITAQGNDGSLSVVTGTKATTGAVGNSTNTLTGAVNGAAVVIALKPSVATTKVYIVNTPMAA